VAGASCGDVRFVIPSEVEESLDISDHTAVGNIKRCLDFARHDKRGVPSAVAVVGDPGIVGFADVDRDHRSRLQSFS
jgi:hypothetical protein